MLAAAVRNIKLLFGILVAAAVMFLLMNAGILQFGKYGCGIEPGINLGAPLAHADAGCPASLNGAMSDAEWAADRYESIAKARKTAGLFYDEDGIEHEFRSGDEKGDDAERARELLRQIGAPTDRTGRYPAATHVEVKVVALMREQDVRRGVLVINNAPCGGDDGLSCQELLPSLVPNGTVLGVWYPSGGKMKFTRYG